MFNDDCKDRLNMIKSHCDSIIDILITPEYVKAEKLNSLLKAIETIDNQYKSLCEEFDEEQELDFKDSFYNHDCGLCCEFYIEANDWHEISLAYRELIKDIKNKDLLEKT